MKVVDNIGVKEILCIWVLGGLLWCYVGIGDVIVVIVKDVILGGNVKWGDVVKVVVVCIVKECWCFDGSYIKFDENVVVIIKFDNDLCGICIFGLVGCELWEKWFMKIILLVLEVL